MADIYWIWYPGDFEVYHGMRQNLEREERGFRWAAFWHLSDYRKNIRFYKDVVLKNKETFKVVSHSLGYVEIDKKKHPFGVEIEIGPGKHAIVVYAAMMDGVPSIYVTGNTICSDCSWLVDDFVTSPVPVGLSPKYRYDNQNPSVWQYSKRTVEPVNKEQREGGVLFTFATQVVAKVCLHFEKNFFPIHLCYGESKAEAMDTKMCYYSQFIRSIDEDIPARAFRYLFVPDTDADDIELLAEEVYEPLEIQAQFTCPDVELNKIWDVAVRTFQLCSGIFFIDGVKRDRWIWSGDAYQSYFINQYLMFDEEISKRTIWALRGNDPIKQHINTIVDYSMYWIMSVYEHYFMTADLAFVRAILPKVVSMMEYLEQQLNEDGFLIGRAEDWIFIDWADLDKDGAVCAEQILLARCYEVVGELFNEVGENGEVYQAKYQQLVANINSFYWDSQKKAYIDSFSSGKQHVSRHSNIFAILFGIADANQIDEICRNVIENSAIAPITTPYFKFYELEVLCRLGKAREVKQIIKEYWGGMLKLGAATFWEEYDPDKSGSGHYEMYGDPFGKSLCHAWGASPIYIIGRYFMGVKPLKKAYGEFVVEPNLSLFDQFECTVPIKGGTVWISWGDGKLRVKTDRPGGLLRCEGREWMLKMGEELLVP